MIPATSDIVDIDTLPGEEIEFGIGDPRWIMRTQADLYSDITTAIIREYCNNAWDAHVMAGHDDPIEVTLPSMMNNNTFEVRDHGVGISHSLFKDIYTQFGESDKRKSSDTNGMLGYGSKSGVAYTTQFSVTSVRDGMKIEGIIKRRPDWSIVLKVISHKKTDEPNGTVIRIPVHNVDEFRHKAMALFKFWLPGRVLVDGVAPKHEVGRKIADNLYASLHWDKSYVVMANVPYEIRNPRALFENSKMNFVHFVAYVDDIPMKDGAQAVEFTPSREDLKYTDRTKETLQEVIDNFEAEIVATATKEIQKAASHAEAWKAYATWTEALGRQMFGDLEYKGEKFKSNFPFNGTRYRPSRTRYSTQRINEWNVESSPKTVFVTECPITVSSNVKFKAKAYADSKNWDRQNILFTSDPASSIRTPWIDRSQFVTWAEVKEAIPTPAAPSNGTYGWNAGRVKGSWDYWDIDAGTYLREQPLPEDATTILYVTVKQAKHTYPQELAAKIGEKGIVLLEVPQNRLAKLLRENPQVKPLREYAQSKVVIDAVTLLTPDAMAFLSMGEHTRNWVNALDVAQLDDPFFAKAKTVLASGADSMKAYNRNMNLANACGLGYTVKKHTVVGRDDHVKGVYPLLTSLNRFSIHEHVYMYMNAAFAADKENKK